MASLSPQPPGMPERTKSTSSQMSRSSISTMEVPVAPLQPDLSHPNSPLEPFTAVSRLSDSDLLSVRLAIGALKDQESEIIVHTTSLLWPPHGLPPGLYRDVVRARSVSMWQYYLCSLFFNSSLILQLLLGAAVTVISTSQASGVLITVLAAANTVIAGLLALMHNSGLPDRFKKDWSEFENVEMWLHEVMRGGIIREGMTREQVIEYGFALFRRARGVVAANKPAAYVGSSSGGTGKGE